MHVTLLALSWLTVVSAEPAKVSADLDLKVLETIRDAALKSDWAYTHLAELTDKIGPRLSGSAGAEAAVVQVAAAMRASGLNVTLQPVKVPHWVRGEERAELVGYKGRPQGITQRIHLTALGSSSSTAPEGLTAQVMIVHSTPELEARAREVPGKIVLFDTPFDEQLAQNGEQAQAYVQSAAARFRAPAKCAQLGAAATLVRSVGGASYRLPHTGQTSSPADGGVSIAAAVTTEDAALINRLAGQGPVMMKLIVTPQSLPMVESHNVLIELKGREKPDEVVIVSGHLDSWDLGTGALDDGAGVMSALAALQVLKSLGLKPRRTIRAIAWMNEENGAFGGDAYLAANSSALGSQVAAIESDSGAGRPLGILANVLPGDSLKKLQPVMQALNPLGATVLKRVDGPLGSDISDLQSTGGVPGFEPYLDGRTYFDYHHTAADTLDKVDPEFLRRQVAVLAVLAYALAEMPEPLPRLRINASP